jgi:hypothetical protein
LPTRISARTVPRLFPETAKKPVELSVNENFPF